MENDSKNPNSQENFIHKSQRILFGSTRNTIITIIVVIILAYLAVQVFGNKSTKVQYQTTQVQRNTVISTVTENGNVASISQATVGSPTTGIIEDIYVKDGDIVAQGQNLFKVKSTATAQEIASAYAAYENAVVTANTASQNKTLNQTTLEKDRAAVIAASSAVTTMQNNINVSAVNPATKQAYTQNDIDAINSALTSAREQFAADEQKYLQSDQNITSANASENSSWLAYQATQDSIVTAPISGTVANIALQVGDGITASSGNLSSELSNSTSSTANSPVLSIGNFTTPYIKVQATEVDVPNIHAGQQATITLDAFPGKTFVGKVEQVDTIGTNASGVITYNVYVSFLAPLSTIKPGMSASVIIQTGRKDNVLTVPNAAIQTTSGQTTVRVLNNGQVTTVPVTTGIASDTQTEITSGLSEGQTVVIGTISSTSQTSGSTSPFSGGLRIGGGFGGGGRGGGGGGGRGG